MPIYDKPTKALMHEFVEDAIKKGQTFKKNDAVKWFGSNYPNIKPTTVRMHVDGMSVNSNTRKHHPSIKPGSGHDLFFKLGSDQYRLWEQETDPVPVYKEDLLARDENDEAEREDSDEVDVEEGAKEFAFERDLREYLTRNLSILETGLKVYEEEEISGIEFPVGGRFIDILAVDNAGNYVVIELKVMNIMKKIL